MWLIFGSLAIIFCILNLIFYFMEKDYKLFMALSLAFTALTLWGNLSFYAKAWESNDLVAIDDTLIYVIKPLLYLTLASIILNMLPLFLKINKNKTD